MTKRPWQQALSSLITDPKRLLEELDLSMNEDEKIFYEKNSQKFPLRVTHSFVRRMQKKNRMDPLLLQVLPLPQEEESHSEFKLDPLEEKKFNPLPGLLHKYPSRVLLTVTGACAIHCRYCFRKNFSYKENQYSQSFESIIQYIENHPQINEVILSGGDPLSVPDSVLESLSQGLKRLKQLKYFRIHSRIPIVLPERIDASFLDWLSSLPWKTVVVLHCNHPQEINGDVLEAIHQLKSRQITLLNQSVLLKHVNDDPKILTELSHALFSAGVMPYYLHQMDKVSGTQHFYVDKVRANLIYHQFAERVSGYLLPKWVEERPYQLFKTPLFQAC